MTDKPLLIIAGPTATGKTSLALKLAPQFNADLVSADSRQIFISMDIGTGKDIPPQAVLKQSKLQFQNQPIPYYQLNSARLWGYDLLYPSQSLSIAIYNRAIKKISHYLWKQGKLPILVGGSGLYIQSLINPPQTLHVPIDHQLRQRLNSYPLEKLQQHLKNNKPDKWSQMNHSDQKNPRRLIRAIEVSHQSPALKRSSVLTLNYLFIVLKPNLHTLGQNIKARVYQRLQAGFDLEARQLLNQSPKLSPQAYATLGYRQWFKYLKGELTHEEAIAEWVNKEIQYSKRQLTWFKKQTNVHWINLNQTNWYQNIVGQVKSWYAN